MVFVIKKILDRIQQSYFKSDAFIELSRKTDDVTAQYEQLVSTFLRFQKKLNSDFQPIINNELEYHKDRNLYVCEKNIFDAIKADKIAFLKKHCGFVSSYATAIRLEELVRLATEIEYNLIEFNNSYANAINIAEDTIPGYVMMLNKKRVLLMLGLNMPVLDKSCVLSKYIFENQDTHEQIEIIFDQDTLRDLSKSIGQPQTPTIMLNMNL
jgi:hypothetical protein